MISESLKTNTTLTELYLNGDDKIYKNIRMMNLEIELLLLFVYQLIYNACSYQLI